MTWCFLHQLVMIFWIVKDPLAFIRAVFLAPHIFFLIVGLFLPCPTLALTSSRLVDIWCIMVIFFWLHVGLLWCILSVICENYETLQLELGSVHCWGPWWTASLKWVVFVFIQGNIPYLVWCKFHVLLLFNSADKCNRNSKYERKNIISEIF